MGSSEGPGVVAVALASGPGFPGDLLRADGGGAASPGARGPAEAWAPDAPPVGWSWRRGRQKRRGDNIEVDDSRGQHADF